MQRNQHEQSSRLVRHRKLGTTVNSLKSSAHSDGGKQPTPRKADQRKVGPKKANEQAPKRNRVKARPAC